MRIFTARSRKPYNRYPPNFGCIAALLLTLGVDIAVAFGIYLGLHRMFW